MSARGLLAIARHEVRRVLPRTPRMWVLALAAVALVAAAAPLAVRHASGPDSGLYPVHVEGNAVLESALAADDRFRRVGDPDDAVLRVMGSGYDADPGRRGQAAVRAMDEALRAWTDDRLQGEADQAAAFPVEVNVVQANPATVLPPAPRPGEPEPGPTVDGPTATEPSPTEPPPATSVLDAVDAPARTGLRPQEVEPPFPIRSLVLSFAYLIPMNFVAQVFAGSLLADRTRRRGLILLSTPLSGGQVLLGRTIPFAAATLAVWAGASFLTGTGALGWLAGLTMVGLVLLAALVIGLVARSERELTFLLTAATTLFATFLFLPAVFTAIPAVAFLSPVAVVAASIRGEAVSLGQFLYATVPLTLVIGALAWLGGALYREETLFSPKRLGAKLLDGLGRTSRGTWRLLLTGILLVPFALALEMFVLALVIPLGLAVVFPAFVIGVALVEEALKMAPALALRRHAATSPQSTPSPWKVGLVVGTGFFLGEKVFLLVSLAGLAELPLGGPSLDILGGGLGLLLIAPLALHVACATVAAHGAGGTPARARTFYALAVLLHVAYNGAVIALGSRA